MLEEILKRLERIESLLQFNKTFLSLDEAADYLQLSKTYMYKMTHSMKIPFYKPNGKKIYFNKEDLDKWIGRNRVKSMLEIEQEAIEYIFNKKGRRS